MDGTILSQGSFIAPATIVNKIIQIPSGVDWIRVVNNTRKGTVGGAAAQGNTFFWQRGMAAGTGNVDYYSNGSTVVNGDTLATGGFTLYDPSGTTPGAVPLVGAPIAFTGISNATRPIVLTATTTGLAVGSVVRISTPSPDTALSQSVNGIDFVVGAINAGVSFTLMTASNALANVPGLTTGTGHFRIVNYPALYYPRNRVITNITQAANGQVSTSIAHGLTPGQEIRFNIPSISGMVELNAQPLNNNFPQGSFANAYVASVVDDYNFTISINTTSYTAFTYPTVAQMPGSLPQVIPFGEDTAAALSINASQVPTTSGLQIPNTQSGILADATTNTGILGMLLGVGGNGAVSGANITGPAGAVAGDVMYWVAGKSTYGGS